MRTDEQRTSHFRDYDADFLRHDACRLRRGMVSVCLLVWCLGQPSVPFERVTFMQDIRGDTG